MSLGRWAIVAAIVLALSLLVFAIFAAIDSTTRDTLPGAALGVPPPVWCAYRQLTVGHTVLFFICRG
jgi:hypothetical protein